MCYINELVLPSSDNSSALANSGSVSLTNLTKSAHRHQDSAAHYKEFKNFFILVELEAMRFWGWVWWVCAHTHAVCWCCRVLCRDFLHSSAPMMSVHVCWSCVSEPVVRCVRAVDILKKAPKKHSDFATLKAQCQTPRFATANDCIKTDTIKAVQKVMLSSQSPPGGWLQYRS